MVTVNRPPVTQRRRPRTFPKDAERIWKQSDFGPCAVCGIPGPLVRHHILYAQVIRREGREDALYDLRNALAVGAPYAWGGRCFCHLNHHSGHRRIPFSLLPESAHEFARQILGDDAASIFLLREYALAPKDADCG